MGVFRVGSFGAEKNWTRFVPTRTTPPICAGCSDASSIAAWAAGWRSATITGLLSRSLWMRLRMSRSSLRVQVSSPKLAPAAGMARAGVPLIPGGVTSKVLARLCFHAAQPSEDFHPEEVAGNQIDGHVAWADFADAEGRRSQ